MKISFLIALYIDSDDRLSNLDTCIDNLSFHFPECEIVVSEMDKESKILNRYPKIKHIFTKTEDFFNKQKAYNIALKNSSNDIICLYDADIILKEKIIKRVLGIFSENTVDIVYPYNGYFYDVPKIYHRSIFDKKSIDDIKISDCTLSSDRSVGGAVFFKKEIFIEGGCGNENFKGAGYEDNEIYERFRVLGYKIARINAPLFHLNHQRKETSFDYNPHNNENQKEFIRICNMSKNQLLEEIKKWNYAS